MMKTIDRLAKMVLLAGVFLAAAKLAFAKEETVTLLFPNAATVHVQNKSIKLVVDSPNDEGKSAAVALQERIRATLFPGNLTLREEDNSPDLVLEAKVLKCSHNEGVRDKVLTEVEKILLVTLWKNKIPQVYVVEANFEVAYRLLDVKDNQSLDGSALGRPVHLEYPVSRYGTSNSAPKGEAVLDELVRGSADAISGRLADIPVSISVKLLKKKPLGNFVHLAQAGQWLQYLEALNALLEGNEKVNGDRKYDMGVAYEAFAYKEMTQDLKKTERCLMLAEQSYREAQQTNPGESEYATGINRLTKARASYERYRARAVAEPVDQVETGGNYEAAFAQARSGDCDRAYQEAVFLVSQDLFNYKADILRIALAAMLKRTGPEDPKNLIRLSKQRAPMGATVDSDVEAMKALLAVVPRPTEPEALRISPYVHARMALVVGIGKFKDPRITSLGFTVADATALADVLRNELHFTVQLLVDEQATRYNIQTEVDRLAKLSAPEDLVVIYLSSHGSPEGADMAGVNYIVTHDTQFSNLYPTAYKMEDLLNDVKSRIPAERVVAFLDTCFSGGTFTELPPDWDKSRSWPMEYGVPTDSLGKSLRQAGRQISLTDETGGKGKVQGVGRVIIASSRQDQKSWEDDKIGHGYFTYFLIQGLQEKTPLNVDGLFDFLKTNVAKKVFEEKGVQQNPMMVKNHDGEISIFLREPNP